MVSYNGWGEWKNHVLKELTRFQTNLEKIDNRLSQIESDLSKLKIKSGIIGGIIVLVAHYGLRQFGL